MNGMFSECQVSGIDVRVDRVGDPELVGYVVTGPLAISNEESAASESSEWTTQQDILISSSRLGKVVFGVVVIVEAYLRLWY